MNLGTMKKSGLFTGKKTTVLILFMIVGLFSGFWLLDSENANNYASGSNVNRPAGAIVNPVRAPETWIRQNEPNRGSATNALSEEARRELARNLNDAWAVELFGLNAGATFTSISAAAERIFDRGSEKDIAFLFNYLETPPPDRLTGYEWTALQERVVDYLVDEWPQHERAEQQLLAMLENMNTFDSVKNAIVERLDKLYLRSSNPEPIEQTLWEMTALPDNDIAATSLATLARLSEASSAIEKSELRDVATEVMSSGIVSVSTKVTAMEIAGWLQSEESYPAALDIIKQENQPDLVKLAAISTIIKEGNPADAEAMARLVESQPYPVNRAAEEAVKQLTGQK